jgi:teichuronic acid biosynthesis glycosyltransferase TuaG
MKALVSIIMPVFNAERYVVEAITSVIGQSYTHWELLIVNDGSTDSSRERIMEVEDGRIRYFEQPNKGTSAARNVGLTNMGGEFFCFLDADDVLTPNSIRCRLEIFDQDPTLAFVGGAQEQRNHDLSQYIKTQVPGYRGMPAKGLIRLDQQCFINCGTWLIKKRHDRKYAFFEEFTHSEDIAFFLTISGDGTLGYTTEVVQIYRRHQSAMKNLEGLHDGYKKFYRLAAEGNYGESVADIVYLRGRIKRIMFRSFLRSGSVFRAIRVLLDNVE